MLLASATLVGPKRQRQRGKAQVGWFMVGSLVGQHMLKTHFLFVVLISPHHPPPQVNDALSNILLDGWIKLVQATERIHQAVSGADGILDGTH